jgi:hypothetical protein
MVPLLTLIGDEFNLLNRRRGVFGVQTSLDDGQAASANEL